MQTHLIALRAGQIDFNRFARETWKQWEALAGKLYRRYPLPRDVEPIDLVQEMLVAAWHAARVWDPKYGSALKTYVTWTAYNEAKRWMHRQRDAYRRSDHSPSRHAIAFADLVGPDQEEATLQDSLASVPAAGEATVAALEEFAQIVCELDGETAAVIELWASVGSSTAAADALMADARLVSAMNLWTAGAARRVVHKAIEATLRVADA